MAVLFVLVLPLHYKIRKAVVATYDRAMSTTQMQTVIVIVGALVALLFVDSWRRAQISVFLHHHASAASSADPAGQGSVTPIQALASRSYNQRNIYISGFILYFSFCIPTVMSVVRRLVKYETLVRDQRANAKTAGAAAAADASSVDDNDEYTKLERQLAQKRASLKALKTQKKNLEAHFDASVKGDEPAAETKKHN